jgi:predicted  nucleic acid-binding Zn-ribbon protein
MPGSADILKELHRLRLFAGELQTQIDRGPTVLKNQQAKVTKQEQAHREGQETLKKLKITIHEKEVSLKAKTQQIDKHRLQLNSASSKKEYDALKHEIAHDEQASKLLEDEILTAMVEADEKTSLLPELEQALRKAKEDLAQFEKNHQTRMAELSTQLNQTHQDLKTAEDSLHEDIRPAYHRMIAKGEDAMSAVHGHTCRACYTEITAQNYNDLLKGLFVQCKSCGRILYLAE